MLVGLSIRDVVLIDRLDLSLHRGLCVLTGETGAGKSILLDALGLALGNRADNGLVRSGAAQASVSATFEVSSSHPALSLLAQQGLTTEDGYLVLRRTVTADGRSRAFINDQAISVGLLRAVGDCLAEIQGQFEARGLLDVSTHRDLVDCFAGLEDHASRVAQLWESWRAAEAARSKAASDLDQAKREEAYLRHAVEELTGLDPKPGEEAALAEQRSLLLHGEKLIEAINGAFEALSGIDRHPGAESALGSARRLLERVADRAGGRLDAVLSALDRATAETEEARALLQSLTADIDLDPHELEQVEERLFALRELARKHGTEADRLSGLRDDMARRLAAIEGGDERVEDLGRQCETARAAYLVAAEELSVVRRSTAKMLDQAITAELAPLKLESATFQTRVDRLEPTQWGMHGVDRIAFEISTNPNTPVGPLGRVASGGELARFLLAIKVVLAGAAPSRTLVFDEVDSGIGGATAHAVGERLERLARDRQVLVVTHSPQVAARGAHHWRVCKDAVGAGVATIVRELPPSDRREEIARMLSGARVTEEARAAADRLMGAA